jgi:hypothetical protein
MQLFHDCEHSNLKVDIHHRGSDGFQHEYNIIEPVEGLAEVSLAQIGQSAPTLHLKASRLEQSRRRIHLVLERVTEYLQKFIRRVIFCICKGKRKLAPTVNSQIAINRQNFKYFNTRIIKKNVQQNILLRI